MAIQELYNSHSYFEILMQVVMTEATVAALYDRFDTRIKAREQAMSEARAAAEETQHDTKRGGKSAERKRQKLALSGGDTLSEQHIDRVKTTLAGFVREQS